MRRFQPVRPARAVAGRLARVLVALACGTLLAGCGEDHPAPPASQVPDFTLTDVNPNSATAAAPVSPRRQLDRVSAWYFGHAT